jgi:endonuclease III
MVNENFTVNTVLKKLEEVFPTPVEPTGKTGATAFQQLVSVMLSAQSKDANTVKASRQLFNVADTPEKILGLPEETMKELIKPAGLYNSKTASVKRMCKVLLEDFDGKVPETREKLMSLPGVGRKSADIMLRFAFKGDAIAVDTHVFRLTKRLGVVEGNTEEKVAEYLDKNVDTSLRKNAHMLLVTFGRETCKARAPKCGECIFKNECVFYKTVSVQKK